MAPELILALVEDDGQTPPITTYSDVYSFACVCLEVIHASQIRPQQILTSWKVATGQLPFPHRTNDHAVTVDIMRGVRPCRGASPCHIQCNDVDAVWTMLEQCWDPAFQLRPTMSEITNFLRGQCGHASKYENRRPLRGSCS